VLVTVFGGWALHEGLPLAIHHVHAAVKGKICSVDEIDLVTSHGVATVGDLLPTMSYMVEKMHSKAMEAYVVTSKGHADRLIAESNMHQYFGSVWHLESHEPRGVAEDANWSGRSLTVPPHQFVSCARAGDVARFGGHDAFQQAMCMKRWAEEDLKRYARYTRSVGALLWDMSRANVVVKTDAPGCANIAINY
jgi:hypothetical protein